MRTQVIYQPGSNVAGVALDGTEHAEHVSRVLQDDISPPA